MSAVSRETMAMLDRFGNAIIEESAHQNLVSSGSIEKLRERHIDDSLQLIALAPPRGTWIDIGSGGGFPGLVIALATDRYRVTLVEPRAKRAAFLTKMIHEFGLGGHTEVLQQRVETVERKADIISARAVAHLDRLLSMAHHLAHSSTLWLLPKGRTAADELAAACKTWSGAMELVPSQTHPASFIVVARDIRPKLQQ